MKLVQKTLLASAVAVAFSSAAFADVTLSGKVAAEAQFITKLNHKEDDALLLDSDGLSVDVDGEYDILGGSQAGFHFGITSTSDRPAKYDTGKKTWVGGQNLVVDAASLFFKGDWGTFTFGRQDAPSDSIANDLWDNTQIAASSGNFVGGTYDNSLGFSYGDLDADTFNVAVMVAAVNKQFVAAGENRKMVTSDQFVSDIAAKVKVGPATLKAGAVYNAAKNNTSKAGVLGVDADLGDVSLTGTVGLYKVPAPGSTDGKITADLLLGGEFKVSDLVQAKLTFAMNDVGDQNKDKLTPIEVSAGADYILSEDKNIKAFTVLNFKNKEHASKSAKDQVGVGAGVTLSF